MLTALSLLSLLTATLSGYESLERVEKAVSVLFPNEDELFNKSSKNRIRGTVTFEQCDHDQVRIYGEIVGLPKYKKFGFHVHEFGNISGNCLATGGHYNPFNKSHGGPHDEERHVGDLGNIYSDKYGVATFDIMDSLIKLNGEHNVIGRGVVIHERLDDLVTDPTGDAGDRPACGVIGISKTHKESTPSPVYYHTPSPVDHYTPSPTDYEHEPEDDHYQNSCIAMVLQRGKPREEIRFLVNGPRLQDVFINGCPRWEIRPAFGFGCDGECFSIKYLENGEFLSNDIDIFEFNLSPEVYGDHELWYIRSGKDKQIKFINRESEEFLCSTSVSVGSVGMESEDTHLCDWDINQIV